MQPAPPREAVNSRLHRVGSIVGWCAVYGALLLGLWFAVHAVFSPTHDALVDQPSFWALILIPHLILSAGVGRRWALLLPLIPWGGWVALLTPDWIVGDCGEDSCEGLLLGPLVFGVLPAVLAMYAGLLVRVRLERSSGTDG